MQPGSCLDSDAMIITDPMFVFLLVRVCILCSQIRFIDDRAQSTYAASSSSNVNVAGESNVATSIGSPRQLAKCMCVTLFGRRKHIKKEFGRGWVGWLAQKRISPLRFSTRPLNHPISTSLCLHPLPHPSSPPPSPVWPRHLYHLHCSSAPCIHPSSSRPST